MYSLSRARSTGAHVTTGDPRTLLYKHSPDRWRTAQQSTPTHLVSVGPSSAATIPNSTPRRRPHCAAHTQIYN